MIPYSRQSINEDDIVAVEKVLRSDFLTQGKVVADFERALAARAKTRFAVSVSSGTAALHLAYQVIGLKEGDEIINDISEFRASVKKNDFGFRPVLRFVRNILKRRK